MSLITRQADNANAASLANRLRRRRFALFLELARDLPRPIQVLDVGGTEHFWRTMVSDRLAEFTVTILNLGVEPVTQSGFRRIAGDARSMPEFGDRSFDLVFSNSVIEHVGSFEDQQAMAREVQRIGRKYFVQTPARSFPLEPHFLLPFFHYWPEVLKLWVLAHHAVGWYPRLESKDAARAFLGGFRLLNERELRLLFPSARILRERFCGFTKSYMAVG